MGNQIALAQTGLLDLLARGKTPSLPAWARHSQAALAVNLQTTETGRFADVLTLPAAMIPDEAQRMELQAHINGLNLCLSETAENDERCAIKVAEICSKLILVLGGQKNELAAEAKGEAYAETLEDIPWWAIKAAARDWHRHECGNDERGKPYDYAWAPDPGAIRRIAMRHIYEVQAEIRNAQSLLSAKPYIDCSAELARGLLAVKGLFRAINDRETLENLTFEAAIAKGESDAA